MIPLFVMGLIFRDRKSEEFSSRLSIKAARIGVTLGIAAAVAFEVIPPLAAVFGGGVIPAIAATVLVL